MSTQLEKGKQILYEEGLVSFLKCVFLFLLYLIKQVFVRTICVEVCEKNMVDMKSILDKVGIRFWLSNGTFLGVYRDRALIPYDSDIDLAMRFEDFKKMVSLEHAFNEIGFELESPCYNKVVLFRDGEQIDINFFKVNDGKRVWNFFRYGLSAFEVLNEISFLGRSWRIFSEPERWLEYIYGEDWRTPIKGKKMRGLPHGENLRD